MLLLLLVILLSYGEIAEIILSKADMDKGTQSHSIAFILYCTPDRDNCKDPTVHFLDSFY